MATPEEILITQAALDAALPDLSRFTVETGSVDVSHLVVPDSGWNTDVRVRIGRSGMGVLMTVTRMGRTEAGSGWTKLMDMPAGFNPVTEVYFASRRGTAARVNANTRAVELLAPPTTVDELSFSFITYEDAPNL